MELKNFSYLFINFLIVIGPLLYSFEKKVYFWGKIKYVLLSILASNIIFITWDVIATYLGHWNFAEDHLTGIDIANLPLEEVLFFFTANYAILFLYEVFVVKFKPYTKEPNDDLIHKIHLYLLFFFAILLILLGFDGYTGIALSLTIIFLLFETLFTFYAKIKRFYIYLLLVFAVFFIFNTILTSIPIVIYEPSAIIGVRIGTIPLEDIFFNYLMVLTTLRIYLQLQKRKI